MCESAAYVLKGDTEELVLEGIDVMENQDGQIRLVNILGEEKIIRARVRTLSLVDHKILLETP